MFTID